MNIKSEIQIILDNSDTNELSWAKGNAFERMVRWILESRDYVATPNVNITNGEIDLWCNHKFDNETLFVECKAKSKISVTDLQTFGFKVSRKKPDKAYFIHTTELEHDAAGIKKEEFDKHSDLKHITFYDPSTIISLLVSQKKIHTIDETLLPNEVTKRFLIFSYIGEYYAFIANTTTLASPNEFCLLSAKDGTPVSDNKTVQIIKDRIPELKKLEFKSPENQVKSPKRLNETKTETVVEIPESDTWHDFKPASDKHFIGRKKIRYDFLHFFKDVAANKTKNRIFYLAARSGMGKSSLINAIKGTCSNKQHKKKFFAFAVDSINAETQRFVGLAFEKMLMKALQNGFIESSKVKSKKISFISDYDLLSSNSVQEILKYLKVNDKVLILIFDQFEDVFRREHLYKPFHEFLLHVNDAQSNIILGFSWKKEITLSPDSESHKFWLQAKNLSKPFELDGFNNEELNLIIGQLEKEPKVGKLPKGLKDMLTEYSEGYPWLIKKLCTHIFNEIYKGRKISELSKSNLNVPELFKQDVEGLNNDELKTLNTIADFADKGRFIHESDIPEIVASEIILSLLQKRLIVKSGAIYKPYWDVFREFILTGNVPALTINFFLRQSPEACLSVYQIFKSEEKYTLDELHGLYSKKKTIKKGHFENILIELRKLDLVIKEDDSGYYFIQEKIQPSLSHFTRIARQRILNSKTIQEIDNSLEVMLDSNDIARILKKNFSFASVSDESWISYAKTFILWVYFLDMEQKNKLIKHDRGRGSNKDFFSIKDELILQTYPEKLCTSFKLILDKGLLQYRTALTSSLSRDLRVLGIIEKKGDSFQLTIEGESLKEIPELEFKKAISRSAQKLEKIQTTINVIRVNTNITAYQLYKKNPELFGQGIKSKSSGQVYASKLISWADFILRAESNFTVQNIISSKTIKKEIYKKVEGLLRSNIQKSIEAWETQYRNLQEYFTKYKHTNLKARDGSLGTWVVAQRQYKSTLSKEQIERLDKLNFIWDPRELQWEKMFLEWKVYQQKYPDRPILTQDLDFPKLGRWIDKQRKQKRQNTLPKHRFIKLDATNFPWDTIIHWKDSYKKLKKFYDDNGHINLPFLPEYSQLRSWITTQRFRIKNNKLAENKIRQLEKIGLSK